jgi:hypothetical protein
MALESIERELCTLAGQIAAANCRFLYLLADFDAREGWVGVNIRSCAHWLSWRCGLDIRTAREHLRVARALKQLPHLREVFAQGRVSYSKARAIARVATPDNETELVEAALHTTAAQVERLTRGLHTAPQNENQEAGAATGPTDETRYGARGHFDDDGSFVFGGRLAPADGARLIAAITRAETERLRTEPREPIETSGTDRSLELRDPDPSSRPLLSSDSDKPAGDTLPQGSRSDLRRLLPVLGAPPADLGPALIAMAEMVCSAASAPIHAPGAEVIVQVDAKTLFEAIRQDDPGVPQNAAGSSQGSPAERRSDAAPQERNPDLEQSDPGVRPNPDTEDQAPVPRLSGRVSRLQDGPALYAASLRALAEDGRLRTAVIAGDGRTLNLGRARRTVSQRQLLALWRRDHGCAVPGCGRIRFLHAHHVVYWSLGGTTDIDNLVLLCGEHHRAVHDGNFTIRAQGRQRFTFHDPSGGQYQVCPSVHGSADDLGSQTFDIGPDDIVPDWDGSPLRLDRGVSAYLSQWAVRARKPDASRQVKAAAEVARESMAMAARSAASGAHAAA